MGVTGRQERAKVLRGLFALYCVAMPAWAGAAAVAPEGFSASLETELGMPVGVDGEADTALKLRLSWHYKGPSDTRFSVEQSASDESWTPIAETALEGEHKGELRCRRLTQKNVGESCAQASGGVISFRIRAHNAQGVSDYVYTSVHLPHRPQAASDIEGLIIYGPQNGIGLSWQDNADNETGYHVQWRKAEEEYGQTVVLPANSTHYDIISRQIEPDTQYVIKVLPYNIFYPQAEQTQGQLAITTPTMTLALLAPQDGGSYSTEVPLTVRTSFLAADPYVLFDWWWLPPDGADPVAKDVMSTMQLTLDTGDTSATVPVSRFDQPGNWRLRMRYIKRGSNIVIDRNIKIKK